MLKETIDVVPYKRCFSLHPPCFSRLRRYKTKLRRLANKKGLSSTTLKLTRITCVGIWFFQGVHCLFLPQRNKSKFLITRMRFLIWSACLTDPHSLDTCKLEFCLRNKPILYAFWHLNLRPTWHPDSLFCFFPKLSRDGSTKECPTCPTSTTNTTNPNACGHSDDLHYLLRSCNAGHGTCKCRAFAGNPCACNNTKVLRCHICGGTGIAIWFYIHKRTLINDSIGRLSHHSSFLAELIFINLRHQFVNPFFCSCNSATESASDWIAVH